MSAPTRGTSRRVGRFQRSSRAGACGDTAVLTARRPTFAHQWGALRWLPVACFGSGMVAGCTRVDNPCVSRSPEWTHRLHPWWSGRSPEWRSLRSSRSCARRAGQFPVPVRPRSRRHRARCPASTPPARRRRRPSSRPQAARPRSRRGQPRRPRSDSRRRTRASTTSSAARIRRRPASRSSPATAPTRPSPGCTTSATSTASRSSPRT